MIKQPLFDHYDFCHVISLSHVFTNFELSSIGLIETGLSDHSGLLLESLLANV